MATEPRAPDLLVVFAGADFRKEFAVRSWRAGAARALALSVARFEWRRVPALELPETGGLVDLVGATPPPERLFLLLAEGDRVEARRVSKGRWGTWSEARAFASLIRERGARSVLVCTSGYHLPRALLSLRRALDAEGGADCEIAALPAPEPADSPLAPARRGRSPRAWLALSREGFKRVVYSLGIPMRSDPIIR
ncbi:MAG TPA: ElyC/SanA/YdcF family protein [Candidatus Eisenbacteria bacterium]|nr:ElyC/SanA/YdcF family protein [Candidatus Eisenbacteria bacterium]